MSFKYAVVCLSLLLPFQVVAQTPVSSDKQVLIDRVLVLWPVENVAIAMVQRPALEALQQSRAALQGRVTAQKQELVLKDVTADVKNYLEEVTPLVRQVAEKSKSVALSPLLAEHFTDTELLQLIALLESPIKKKFESLSPELEKSFGEHVAGQAGQSINSKLEALSKTISGKLRAAALVPR